MTERTALPIRFSRIRVVFLVRNCLAAVTVVAACGGVAPAEPPSVRFDTIHLVACRDVTPEEFARTNPNERLLQARLEVSLLIAAGREDDLILSFYRVTSPSRSLQVVDYQPRTTLTTDYAGSIGVEEKKESSRSAGLAVTGAWDHLIKATGNGDMGSRDSSTVRYELVTPMESLSASGSVDRGCGVYFKLKPSRQTSLEGAKPFTLVFRTRRQWRGDYLHLRCEARGIRRGVVRHLDEQIRCGGRDFFVALYAEGDEQAKLAAERFVAAEAGLVEVIRAHRDEIESLSRATVTQKLVAFLDGVEPPTPKKSLDQLIYGSATSQGHPISDKLPEAVRQSAAAYAAAKLDLRRFNGRDDLAVEWTPAPCETTD